MDDIDTDVNIRDNNVNRRNFEQMANVNLRDLIPTCANDFRSRPRSRNVFKGIYIHVMASMITIAICFVVFKCSSSVILSKLNIPYFPSIFNEETSTDSTSSGSTDIDFNNYHQSAESKNMETFCNVKFNMIKNELEEMHRWRSNINSYISKMQWEHEREMNTLIQNALEMYEADGIGLMDYAAIYSGGTVVEISENTRPYPTHRPLSIFKIVNVELLSNPEEILRPCLLPGYCFAFKGDHGRIKIRLGRPIIIGSVTISHASRYLLDLNELASAPKEFEVFGFKNDVDPNGVFLGKFIYDWMGKQHQTFEIKTELTKNEYFEMVELSILNNNGRQEFTCVYRFRVHKKFMESPLGFNRTIIG